MITHLLSGGIDSVVMLYYFIKRKEHVRCVLFDYKQNWTKKRIVSTGKSLSVDFHQTWSCYRGGAKPCGECLACKTREEALK